MRCLKQLAEENATIQLKVTRTLLKDFYMDDVLTGCHSCDEAIRVIELQKQLSELLVKE